MLHPVSSVPDWTTAARYSTVLRIQQVQSFREYKIVALVLYCNSGSRVMLSLYMYWNHYNQGRFYGGQGSAASKKLSPCSPQFGPASLDFHLNRPVVSLIQLHIVPPAGIVAPIPHLASVRTAPDYNGFQFPSESNSSWQPWHTRYVPQLNKLTNWLLGKWIGTFLVVFGVANLVKCPD